MGNVDSTIKVGMIIVVYRSAGDLVLQVYKGKKGKRILWEVGRKPNKPAHASFQGNTHTLYDDDEISIMGHVNDPNIQMKIDGHVRGQKYRNE